MTTQSPITDEIMSAAANAYRREAATPYFIPAGLRAALEAAASLLTAPLVAEVGRLNCFADDVQRELAEAEEDVIALEDRLAALTDPPSEKEEVAAAIMLISAETGDGLQSILRAKRMLSQFLSNRKKGGEAVPTNMTEAQIKHMVSRFLQWRLPENFSPDCGIHFDADAAKKMNPQNHRYEPVGTNLFDATQADAMVRFMIEGLAQPPVEDAGGEGRVHHVKCWPEFFVATLAGLKRHEVRRNDRDYRVGDRLVLMEWIPQLEAFSGREFEMAVTYITSTNVPCAMSETVLNPEFCILSVEPVAPPPPPSPVAGGGEEDAPQCGPQRRDLQDAWQQGITWALRRVGRLIGAKTWAQGDGTETVEGDVDCEIRSILHAADMYDPEDGRLAKLSPSPPVAMPEWGKMPHEQQMIIHEAIAGARHGDLDKTIYEAIRRALTPAGVE